MITDACSTPGCTARARARGLCRQHYNKLRCIGTRKLPAHASPSRRDVRQYFEEKYHPEPNSGCFIWTGSIDVSGYGRFNLKGRNWKANRVAWLLENGDPGDLHVLHRCDNRLCVNTGHLFLGTNADNILDRMRKGRTRGSYRHAA